MFNPIEPFRIRDLESRSTSPGNPTGRRGGVPTGQTDHALPLSAGQMLTLADIAGPGMVRSMWLTVSNRSPVALRSLVLRIYWEGSEYPSVEVPFGDFFGLAHGRTAHYSTPWMAVSEGKGFNCYLPMPFASHCRMTLTNEGTTTQDLVYYQVHYTLGDRIEPDVARLHAHFRRQTPPAGEPFVILDTQGSPGVFAGMNISALPTAKGTWREGDFRFYLDGDAAATIVGTGWSDWFGSAWGLGIHQSLYAGSNYQVNHPEFGDKYFCSSYRFHVLDPIYFRTGLRVEHDQRGYPGFVERRQDDWTSAVWWYQHLTGKPLPALPPLSQRIAGLDSPEWERFKPR